MLTLVIRVHVGNRTPILSHVAISSFIYSDIKLTFRIPLLKYIICFFPIAETIYSRPWDLGKNTQRPTDKNVMAYSTSNSSASRPRTRTATGDSSKYSYAYQHFFAQPPPDPSRTRGGERFDTYQDPKDCIQELLANKGNTTDVVASVDDEEIYTEFNGDTGPPGGACNSETNVCI